MRGGRLAVGGLGLIVALGVGFTLRGAPAPPPLDVTVHEGTSMSVGVSPDRDSPRASGSCF